MTTKQSKTSGKARPGLANHEIVVLAAYLSGAQYRYVDTEDIAVKANEIAPGRFNWRKYKDQINIDTVRKRLWDATKPEKGSYLIGSERGGWLVTELGCQFVERNLSKLEWLDLSKSRLSKNEQVWRGRERGRMLGESAYQKFTEGNEKQISAAEAERFFRIDDYVVGNARKAKLERTKNAFAHDSELKKAIHTIAKLVREK